MPVLGELTLPAAIFLTPGGIAGDGNLTLHSHTVTHPILSKCTDEELEKEVFESCAAGERETGCTPGVFAYPNGRSQDFDERPRAVFRRCGVRWALSRIEGFAHPHSDPLALPRIPIGSDLSFARLRLLVSRAVSARQRGLMCRSPWKQWCRHSMRYRREHT